MTSLLSALSVLLTGLAVVAQDRRPLVGVVLDAAGKPVAGARVIVCGETSPGSWITPPDVVAVLADADGRFRAPVLDCVEYSAWASNEDGDVLGSPVLTGITPGARYEIRLGRLAERRLRLSGLEQLGARDLRARLFPGGAGGYSVDVAVDAAVTLPSTLPDVDGHALILGANETPLAWLPFDRTGAGVLQPLRNIRVQAVDAAARPLADVELILLVRHWQPTPPLGSRRRQCEIVLGRTDAQGRAVIRWPSASERPSAVEVLARKPGFASVRSGWIGGDRRFGQQPGPDEPALADDELRFALAPATPITLAVAAGDKRVADVPILALVRDDARCGDHVVLHHERDLVGRTDADGRFVLAEVADATQVIAVRVGAAALQQVGGEVATRAVPPGQPFFLAPRVGADRQCRLDLASLGAMQLQVLDVDGGPAAGAVALLIPTKADPTYPSDRDPRFRLDPAGRANVLLQAGSWWAFVLRDHRAEFVQFDAGAGALRLQLQAIPQLRIRVRDGDGKPVPAARMELQHYSPGNGGGDVPRHQRDLIWVQLAQSWMRTLQADANGDFALPMFPDTKAALNVKLVAGDRSSSAWDLQWVDEPFEVEIR